MGIPLLFLLHLGALGMLLLTFLLDNHLEGLGFESLSVELHPKVRALTLNPEQGVIQQQRLLLGAGLRGDILYRESVDSRLLHWWKAQDSGQIQVRVDACKHVLVQFKVSEVLNRLGFPFIEHNLGDYLGPVFYLNEASA